jgi:hypothetical protein
VEFLLEAAEGTNARGKPHLWQADKRIIPPGLETPAKFRRRLDGRAMELVHYPQNAVDLDRKTFCDPPESRVPCKENRTSRILGQRKREAVLRGQSGVPGAMLECTADLFAGKIDDFQPCIFKLTPFVRLKV